MISFNYQLINTLNSDSFDEHQNELSVKDKIKQRQNIILVMRQPSMHPEKLTDTIVEFGELKIPI